MEKIEKFNEFSGPQSSLMKCSPCKSLRTGGYRNLVKISLDCSWSVRMTIVGWRMVVIDSRIFAIIIDTNKVTDDDATKERDANEKEEHEDSYTVDEDGPLEHIRSKQRHHYEPEM